MLTLGKDLNRKYSIRCPFLDGFYKIDVFFNKTTPFLLFGAEQDLPNKHASITLKTFKNIKSSKFCETFFDLHSFYSDNLDIIDQFKNIKDIYDGDIQNILNETIILSKYSDGEKIFFDNLIIYGFTFISYPKDFIFLLAERQSISSRLKKKFVRSTAIQIATKRSLDLLDQFNEDSKREIEGLKPLMTDPNSILTLE